MVSVTSEFIGLHFHGHSYRLACCSLQHTNMSMILYFFCSSWSAWFFFSIVLLCEAFSFSEVSFLWGLFVHCLILFGYSSLFLKDTTLVDHLELE